MGFCLILGCHQAHLIHRPKATSAHLFPVSNQNDILGSTQYDFYFSNRLELGRGRGIQFYFSPSETPTQSSKSSSNVTSSQDPSQLPQVVLHFHSFVVPMFTLKNCPLAVILLCLAFNECLFLFLLNYELLLTDISQLSWVTCWFP